MKKSCLLSLIFPIIMSAQDFSKQEIQLINSGDVNTALRVIQTNVASELNILKSESLDINPTDKNTEILAERMRLAVTHPVSGGVGIAAPQVGINRKLIWVQRFDKKDEPFEAYYNPKIIWQSNLLRKGSEGCLSIEDERGEVYRNYVIEIQYQNQKGKTKTEKIEGFTAVIFQHEIDHLNGILFTDRIQEQQNLELIPLNENVQFYLIRD